MRFIHAGVPAAGLSPFLEAFDETLLRNGHEAVCQPELAGLVIYNLNTKHLKSYRRAGKGVFVIGMATLPATECTLDGLYPLLVRTLSNLLIVFEAGHFPLVAHLVTPESGHVVLSGDGIVDAIYARVEPLATSRLVIDNIFTADLELELWGGDERTASIGRAGRFLAGLNLLPAPFPIERILSPRDLRYIKRTYGMGGLSYGNFSARLDAQRFWMSASGVDKSRLREIGRDILLVTGYDEACNAIRLSVPPDIEPRRVSVDAIEHWMVYTEQPEVGAILHVHAWIEGAVSTELQYPCGTYELGRAVADVVRAAPDPAHAVIGLKNHGLTITGSSLDEILARVSGRLVQNVPMS
jgi:ribulose-5-phosphate 4-epimerase/fuculose-1-phosphate aldolase